jgi:Ankyrin repeats (3 copies)
MKSFVATLLIWAVLFALLWLGAHQLFYPPGDWIGALIASFFITLGIGGLRKARLERRDTDLIAKPEGPPKDGERVAIAGTLEPLDAVLTAPLSGAQCVLYDYEISHIPELPMLLGQSKTNSRRPSPVIDRSGMAMAPVVIRSNLRQVRLLAFPGIERFGKSELGDGTRERARAYIAATKFEEQSILGATGQVARVLDDRSGCLRVDWKSTSHDDLENSSFAERRVDAGAKVCVIGLYSAKDNAIVPQADVGGTKLIKGTREEALSFMRDTRTGSIIAAVLFLAIPAPVTFGALMYREQYNEKHNEPTVRSARLEAANAPPQVSGSTTPEILKQEAEANAVNERDAALGTAPDPQAANALIAAGANVDSRDRNGYTPLMKQASLGNAEVIRVLIEHHADISAKEPTMQMTALDIAIANKNVDAVKVLREAGARSTR